MAHIKLKDLIRESHKLDEGFIDIFKKIFPSRNTQNFTPKQKEILYDYTKAGYNNINHHLRTKHGIKDLTPDRDYKEYHPYEIEDKIGLISSAFTKENTNQTTITVHTGIPPEFGEKLINGIGQTFNFSGFTSTSLDRNIALNFGELYSNDNNIYIITCICPQHTALDIQKISHNKGESEQLIDRGAKFKVLSYDSNADEYTFRSDRVYETDTRWGLIVHEIKIKLFGDKSQ